MSDSRYFRTFLMVATTGFLMGASPPTATLSVNVTGVDSSKGEIFIGVMDGPAGFPTKRKTVAAKTIKASPGPVKAVFSGLAAGRYAVAVWQDNNGNGKQDKNLFGAPTEPYGFSNNARGRFGPPDFDKAAFTLDSKDKSITVSVK